MYIQFCEKSKQSGNKIVCRKKYKFSKLNQEDIDKPNRSMIMKRI